ncbi:unnamed protein product [Ceratitis capitata]|uniref:(Mediterranean fruit fly) hypothetical protein n=1 Tax=Ceratitis capitata TaxID=7213 RepID=A0A811V620_CERCA|nr:unnamed protein product [Ceratitis capitata]
MPNNWPQIGCNEEKSERVGGGGDGGKCFLLNANGGKTTTTTTHLSSGEIFNFTCDEVVLDLCCIQPIDFDFDIWEIGWVVLY